MRLAFFKSSGPFKEKELSFATTITSELESRLRRVPGTINPFFSKPSIFSSSAEKNTSALAPSWICRASIDDAPRLKNGRSPVFFSYAGPISLSASVRLAAAKTIISAAPAGTASTSSKTQNSLVSFICPPLEDRPHPQQNLVLVVWLAGRVKEQVIQLRLQVVALDVIVEPEGPHVRRVSDHTNFRIERLEFHHPLQLVRQNFVSGLRIPPLGIHRIERDLVFHFKSRPEVLRPKIQRPEFELRIHRRARPITRKNPIDRRSRRGRV